MSNLNDLYDDVNVNPAAIQVNFYRHNLQEDIKCLSLDNSLDTSLIIINQPQTNLKFLSLCDDDDDYDEDNEDNENNINLEISYIKSDDKISKWPIVELNNFKNPDDENLIPLVEVELFTSDGERIHPYIFKSLSKNILDKLPDFDDKKQNPYKYYYYPNSTNRYYLDKLYIKTVPKYLILEDIERYYYKLQQISKREFKQDSNFYARTELSRFGNLKQVTLKIQCVLYNKKNNKIEKYITKEVKTNTINDISLELINRNDKVEYFTQLSQNLRIIRSSKIVGNIRGNELIFLFVSINGKFDINDIEIEFNQRENNQITWTTRVKPIAIHNNSVIIFETPNYDKESIIQKDNNNNKKTKSIDLNKVDKEKICEHPIKVFYRLFRAKTKEFSAEWTFYYSKSKFTILDDLSISFINQFYDYLSNKEDMEIDNDQIKKTEIVEEEKKEKKKEEEEEEEEDEDNEDDQDDANVETVKNLVDDRKKKMNLLVDRTCGALLEISKSRSIHKLIKIQRYLLNVQNSDGNTPIHIAILNGHFDLVEIFVDIALTIPHYNIINVKNNLQLTPLLLAAYMEEHELVRFLLESTSNLHETDLNGQNCFHIAAKKKNIKLMKILINYVKSNLDKAYLINVCNYEGDTPLHIVCKLNAYELVEELIFSDLCRLNEQNKRTGETPLHYTCYLNYIQLTKLLVKHLLNRKLDIDVQAFNGCTPLHVSIANQNYMITRLLIKSNANTFIQSIQSIHSRFNLNDNFLKFKSINKSILKDKIFMKINKIFLDDNITSLADVKKRTEILVDNNNTINEKVGVEITDVKSNEDDNNNNNNNPNNTNTGMQQITSNNIDILFQHCYNAFNYAINDKLIIKMISNSNNDLYLPKNQINLIMDSELKKKLIHKINLNQLKITSTLETSQIDFIEAIEELMKKLNKDLKLNEDLKLKLKIQNNSFKRRTENDTLIDEDQDYKRTRIKENE